MKYWILFISCIVASCSTSYIPNSVNTPLLKNKNEVQIGANYKMADFFNPVLEPQASYAISKNIGVMVNGSYSLFDNLKKDTIYYKRNFTEAGIGYFKKFAPKFQYEVYGGFGKAKIRERYESDEGNIIVNNTVNYNRYFIQPTIAYVTENTAISFTTRVSYVDFQTSSSPLKNSFVFDPVLSFQFGRKFVYQTQIGGSAFAKQLNGDYNPFLFSIGVKYKFGIQ